MKRRLGWVLAVVLGVGVVALAARAGGELLPGLVSWVRGRGAWGPVAFVALYAVCTVALIPASFLTVASGALFGLAGGVAAAFAGATLGSTLAFLASRYLVRGRVEQWLQGDRRFRSIDRAIGRQGRRVVFLLRLSPVLPFTLLNYALGLTHVRFRDYLLAAVGMLPGTVMYVYPGVLVGEVASLAAREARPRGTAYYLLMALGLLATVAVVVLVTRIARRALAEETDGDGATE